EVLALVRVDASLAADRGVDHAEERRRNLHEPYAAKPGRRNETGEVCHGAAAETDDHVGTGEVGLPQDLPAECRDLDALARLGIRNLGEEYLIAVEERLAKRGGAGAQRRRM